MKSEERSENPSECPWCGSASLLLAGQLPPPEQARFEAHAAACQACAEELDACRRVVAELDVAALAGARSLESPPAPIRARLLAALGARPRPAGASPAVPVAPAPAAAPAPAGYDVQRWKRWTTSPGAELAPGLATLRAGEGPWEETAWRGVRVRPLSVDRTRRYVTMLVQMDPGSDYPAHRHAGAEECLVLEGELQVGELLMHKGDYQRAEAGSVHGVQRTEKGCTLFIVSSQDDELLVGAK